MFKSLSRLGLCAIVATGGLTARANTLSEISGRYWFDFSKELHSFESGSFDVTTDGLEEGFHTLNVYVQNDKGTSVPHSRLFIKHNGLPKDRDDLNCFIYVDGKFNQKSNATAGVGGMISLDLDMNDIELGPHILGVHLTDKEGITQGFSEGAFVRVPSSSQLNTLSAYYQVDGISKGAVAITDGNPMMHLNLDMSELTSGLHSLTTYLASPLGLTTSLKTVWFVKVPKGGEGVKQYSYWLNDDIETKQTVILPEVTNPLYITSLIDMPEMPFRAKSHTFAVEDNAPVLYARNDFKISVSDIDGAVTTSTQSFTDVRVKYQPKEIISLGQNESIIVDPVPSTDVKLYRFDAESGDSINVSLSRPAMLEIYSPTAQSIIRVSGADATINRTMTAHETGMYYVAVHNHASNSATTLHFSHIPRYAMMEQNVTHTANRGKFELEVKGNGFNCLQYLTLVGNEVEYPIKQFNAVDNYTLYAMIDLDEISPTLGEYRLKGIYHNSDEGVTEEVLASTILTIEEATPVDISVKIDAPRVAGTPYLTYIRVTNNSNVGVWGVPFNIAAQNLANGGEIEFVDFDIALGEQLKDEIPVVFKTDNLLNTGVSGSFAPAIIPFLGPGETNTYTIGLNTGPHEVVPIYAWVGKPWSEESSEMMSADYNLSSLQNPFDGNLFTFEELAKLDYQVTNELYGDEDKPKPIPSLTQLGNLRMRIIANVTIGSRTNRESSSDSRMSGNIMNLNTNGSNTFAQHATKSSKNSLMVANDLYAIGCYSLVNHESHSYTTSARTNWKNTVPPQPNPKPNFIEAIQSGDPNDMVGYTAPSGSNYIGTNVKSVTYTIEFENDPAIANASATTIKVNSSVDGSSFNLLSLKALTLKLGDKEMMLPGGHHFVKTLDMRPEINAIAELTFDFNVATGMAEWRLRSLDPMTMEDVTYMEDGILPVNNDSGRGTGYLTFSVDMLSGLADNKTIESSAEIVFDNNKPISTPVWRNVTDFTDPVAYIVSQSTTDDITFDFIVESSDSGSGIWVYDLYMRSVDSSKWEVVKSDIESDSFSYTVEKNLGIPTFAVIATDRAANRQSEAMLYVIAGDADGNGMIDANDVVAVRNYYLDEDSTIHILNADVNGDGVTDTQDATAIINLYLDSNVIKSVKQIKIK